jgi:HEAT repeat protein
MGNVEASREKILEARRKLIEPILTEMKEAGVNAKGIEAKDLVAGDYRKAVPILLKWLPIVEDAYVKETIVRSLSVKYARPLATHVLLEEFHRASPEAELGLKWAIGNALSIVAEKADVDDLLAIVKNPVHGRAREMVVSALGGLKEPKAIPILVDLLNDEDVVGHAIKALGKLKAIEALPAIKKYLNHPNAWVRREVEMAIKKLE